MNHIRGKKPLYVQCVKSIKTLFNEKGDANAKIINQHKMVVKDAREVSYGMEADVEISMGRLKGLARVKIWGPSKSDKSKNKCTIIISKYSNNADSKYAETLSRKIIKPLFESYLKGPGGRDTIKKSNGINKDRVQCTDCEKSFGKRYIKTHMVKIHMNSCDICRNIYKLKKNSVTTRLKSIAKKAFRF